MTLDSPEIRRVAALGRAASARLLAASVQTRPERELQQVVDNFFDETKSMNPLRSAAEIWRQLPMDPVPAPACDAAAGVLTSTLSRLVPAFRAARNWPQIQTFQRRVVEDSMASIRYLFPTSILQAVQADAIAKLPANWFSLGAGICLAVSMPLQALELYPNSAFCMTAEDWLGPFRIGTHHLAESQPMLKSTMSDQERLLADKAYRLLRAMYPSFAARYARVSHLSSDAWSTSIGSIISSTFGSEAMTNAEAMFTSEAGLLLLCRFRFATGNLTTLANSTEYTNVVQRAIRASVDERLGETLALSSLTVPEESEARDQKEAA